MESWYKNILLTDTTQIAIILTCCYHKNQFGTDLVQKYLYWIERWEKWIYFASRPNVLPRTMCNFLWKWIRPLTVKSNPVSWYRRVQKFMKMFKSMRQLLNTRLVGGGSYQRNFETLSAVHFRNHKTWHSYLVVVNLYFCFPLPIS